MVPGVTGKDGRQEHELTKQSRWERDTYFEAKKVQEEYQDSMSPEAALKAPERKREILAEQAKRLKQGRESWQPTWKALGLNFERPIFKPQPTSSSQTTSPVQK